MRVFAAHHELPPRWGWLARGYQALRHDPMALSTKDALMELGVGVAGGEAIRFWMRAFHLAEPAGPRQGLRLTTRARWLLAPETDCEGGADPYLEDTASLWLLHWWLVGEPTSMVPAWWVALHRPITFTRRALAETIIRDTQAAGLKPPTANQVRADVACFIRMYIGELTSADPVRASFEDQINRPFAALHLVHAMDEGRFGINWRAARTAPAPIVAYACLDYAHRQAPRSGGIALSRLTSEPGSPGRVLQLSKDDLVAKLTKMSAGGQLEMDDSLEDDRLIYHETPGRLAWRLLDDFYHGACARLGITYDDLLRGPAERPATPPLF